MVWCCCGTHKYRLALICGNALHPTFFVMMPIYSDSFVFFPNVSIFLMNQKQFTLLAIVYGKNCNFEISVSRIIIRIVADLDFLML